VSEFTGGERQELVERFQARTYPLEPRNPEEATREVEPQVHVYRPDARCITDKSLGETTPQDRRDPFRLVVEASIWLLPVGSLR
jgi:hypothetical protein